MRKRGKREEQDIGRSYIDLVHKQKELKERERENNQRNKEGDSNIAKIERERYKEQQESKNKRWQEFM